MLTIAVTFTLERLEYTVSESNRTLNACVDLVQGELSREVFFNLTYQDITTEGNPCECTVYTLVYNNGFDNSM